MRLGLWGAWTRFSATQRLLLHILFQTPLSQRLLRHDQQAMTKSYPPLYCVDLNHVLLLPVAGRIASYTGYNKAMQGLWPAAYSSRLCTIELSEARKLLSKKEVPSLEDSLVLNALPKGTISPSSPTGKGHSMAIDERLSALPPPRMDRDLMANPSPAIGH
ncbi:hypothetical protein Acr_23g0007750 [Actinidia rufa]|uniref:Uncharacterized protein n=1 Tax=Actinidia rufa TaxID=165716 RepID=A0A7J0GNL4_9ERIC|nr:hypothetical protein Acr_23g0007750 [Actinidia rufa]